MPEILGISKHDHTKKIESLFCEYLGLVKTMGEHFKAIIHGDVMEYVNYKLTGKTVAHTCAVCEFVGITRNII